MTTERPTISLSKYQEYVGASYTGSDTSFDAQLFNAVTGIVGEVGEVVDIIKKVKHQCDPMTEDQRRHLQEEVGDVMWYIARLCLLYDLDMDDVMLSNLTKLCKRYPSASKSWLESLTTSQLYLLNL